MRVKEHLSRIQDSFKNRTANRVHHAPEGVKVFYPRSEIPDPPGEHEIKLLREFLNTFDSEFRFSIESQNSSKEDFYLPLLSVLITYCGILISNFKKCMGKSHLPTQINQHWDNSYVYDRELVQKYFNDQSFDEHSSTTFYNWNAQIKLWLTFFREALWELSVKLFKDYGFSLEPGGGGEYGVEALKEFTPEQRRVLFEAMRAEIGPQPAYTLEPFYWDSFVIYRYTQWLTMLLDPRYRHDGFIYITSEEFPHLMHNYPRLFHGETWITGFGGRLIVPNVKALSSEKKARMWDFLLIKENIYDNPNIDHSIRKEVFELIKAAFPQDAKVHVDVCGGRGDFLQSFRETDQLDEIDHQLVDIAPQAVEFARLHGLRGSTADVDENIPLNDESVDVVTIIYAVQWINESAFMHILRVLKPNGTLIFNVYPPIKEEAERYEKLLKRIGFIDVEMNSYQGEKRTHFILSGKKSPESEVI